MADNDFNSLTQDEEHRLQEAFNTFDEDGSGTIDANELRIVMEMMGQKPNPEEISRLITEADAGTTGEIDFKQFKKVMALQK